ncbi:MAG: pentapeptide repeat-containing protein [Cyanobacteria bacterium P01_E01_bin.42]
MAKIEHLNLLNKGVNEWNEWQSKNAWIEFDLSESDLSNRDLQGVKLIGVNLHKANLSNSNLSNAFLERSNLSKVNLNHANLHKVLIDNFTQLDDKWRRVWEIINQPTSHRNLRDVDLSNANLSNANLSNADLSNADLRKANLRNADLSEADLIGANLSNADLYKTNFLNANLREANLFNANLTGADLFNANLIKTNLKNADLSITLALYTDFEGATLTGTCIWNWNISSETILDNILCEYIYLWVDFTDRRPSDPSKIFAPGDFARLVQKAQETVDLIFRNGIDWQAFSSSFQALKAEQITVEGSDRAFSVRAIENLDDGSFIVRINTPSSADKAEIERSFHAKYQAELQRLEGMYRETLQCKDEQIEQYKRENTNLWALVQREATRSINIENRNIIVNSETIQGAAYTEEIKGSGYTQGDNQVNQ